jgi:cysteine desulfurase
MSALDRVYLDHNATTKPDPEVVAEMLACLERTFGNPFSLHRHGQEARHVVEQARQRVAALVGADPAAVVFTSGGTDSVNRLCRWLEAQAPPGRRHVVTSAVEHQAVLTCCRWLESRGYVVDLVRPGRDGRVSARAVEEAMRPDTALVSVMLANNETGALQPVREIAAAAHARGLVMHTDAVQAAGRVPVSVAELGVDWLTLSAHKIHGPKGVGALVRGPTAAGATEPIRAGDQAAVLRTGTENVPGIAGFGRACELARQRLGADGARVVALRDRLEAALRQAVPEAVPNGDSEPRLPNTLNLSFPGIDGTVLALNLDLEGIAVSTGSACTATNREPSHVLLAMGRTPAEARGAVRFSLGRGNTEAEIDRVAETVSRLWQRLRHRSGGAHDA